ncbi:Fur family transcriptional regulator [Geobacter sp. DSM 9736]|uniref:Fur family transcriptional regulator n=1 Tax=Geobacter sp. DSM 9736 TaxID=1277350 RepID=UPI000B5108F7|nr:Fur family transcriptional regulator [Geobacter sp. DSM 9736]SNB45896.1 Fur family transcriptional regulator, peroxide stress response regulator [Geobacter sp. DSM 9736]
MQKNHEWLQGEISRFENACREAGLRLTHQRLEIYRELASASDHPSAETLHQRLRQRMPMLSLDTVYRTLSTLAQYGLIHKVDTAESQSRFDAAPVKHHHLICSRCKEIVDFGWREIDEAPLPEEIHSWGCIGSKSIVAYGVCRKCLENEVPPSP